MRSIVRKQRYSRSDLKVLEGCSFCEAKHSALCVRCPAGANQEESATQRNMQHILCSVKRDAAEHPAWQAAINAALDFA